MNNPFEETEKESDAPIPRNQWDSLPNIIHRIEIEINSPHSRGIMPDSSSLERSLEFFTSEEKAHLFRDLIYLTITALAVSPAFYYEQPIDSLKNLMAFLPRLAPAILVHFFKNEIFSLLGEESDGHYRESSLR